MPEFLCARDSLSLCVARHVHDFDHMPQVIVKLYHSLIEVFHRCNLHTFSFIVKEILPLCKPFHFNYTQLYSNLSIQSQSTEEPLYYQANTASFRWRIFIASRDYFSNHEIRYLILPTLLPIFTFNLLTLHFLPFLSYFTILLSLIV